MTNYQYDLDGNQTEVKEQTATGWATTDTRYNAEGQVWDVLAPTVEDGRPETVTLYDLDGESCDTQASQINAAGQTVWGATDVTFDADGNAYETQSPPNDLGQRPTSYSFYDGDGSVCFSQTQAEFATGTFTQYSYDSLGEQTEVVGPAVNGISSDTQTSYDDAGNAYQSKALKASPGATDVWQTTTTNFDNEGNATSVRKTQDGGTASFTWTYTFDVFGNVLTEHDPDGDVTTNTYDTVGDLLTQDVNGETTTNVYNAFGDLLSTTDPDGDATTYSVDAFGQDVVQSQGQVIESTPGAAGYSTSGGTATWSFANLAPNYSGNFEIYVQSSSPPVLADYTVSATVIPAADPSSMPLGDDWYDLGSVLLLDGIGGLTVSAAASGATEAVCLLHQASSTVYGPDGTVTSTTDAVGNTTSYQYDLLGNAPRRPTPTGR